MEFKGIERRERGEFIHRYNLHYEAQDGTPITYEMVSRSPDIESFEQIQNHRPDAAVVVVTDSDNTHILLDREFRMELGRVIMGLPGGLIEPGETPEETAARELKEETGLTLTKIYAVFPAAPCAVGLSNESTICVFGTAEGELSHDSSSGEEITPRWYTREEIIEMHKTEVFGSWSMAYSWIWAHGGLPGEK